MESLALTFARIFSNLTAAAVVSVGLIAAIPIGELEAQTKQAESKASPKGDKPLVQAVAKEADIDRNGILILVRSAILALDHANKTGNYTVLRDIGAPGFQVNSAARLAEIFAGHRADGLDLGGVAVLDPVLTSPPRIEPNGMLYVAGYFPSVPMQLNFELLFAPVDRRWKLFGISVNVGRGGPVAPESSTPPPDVSSHEPPEPPTTRIGQTEGARLQEQGQ